QKEINILSLQVALTRGGYIMKRTAEFQNGKLILDCSHFRLGHAPDEAGCALAFSGERIVDEVLGVSSQFERIGKELNALYRNHDGSLISVVVRPAQDPRTGTIHYLVAHENPKDELHVDEE